MLPEKEAPSGKVNILSVGRLGLEKGHDILVRALGTLSRKRPDIDFSAKVIGWGDKRTELEAMADELGIGDKIEFTGGISFGPRLLSYYDQADIFILPSRSEGTPKVILEAMARGVPIIASNVGGVGEMVEDGVTGLLVPPEDEEAVFNAVIKMIEEPETYHSYRVAANEHVRNHSLGSYCAKIIEKFDEVYG